VMVKESSLRMPTLGWLRVFQPEVVGLPLTVAGTLGDLGECEPVRAVALESARHAREAVRVEAFMIAVECDGRTGIWSVSGQTAVLIETDRTRGTTEK
jgi:hypothetical protein